MTEYVFSNPQELEELQKLPPKKKRGIKGILAGLAVLLAKFKVILMAGTMFLSVALYAWAWGWPFAVGLVLLIFVHEMGHSFALRRRGINASIPIFIPFVGAFIAMKEMPRSVALEAETAFAGPLLGTLAALIPWQIAEVTKNPFWLNLAYTGFAINLFNLLPILPLDGGRIAAAISPKIWLLGMIGVVILLFYSFNPILLLIIILSLPRTLEAFKGVTDLNYYDISPGARALTFAGYFGLALFLTLMMVSTYHPAHLG
jgi:Zn-dependent protease